MIQFLPLDFLGVSHRIIWKNENAVYSLQIPALVPEILNFEKCGKLYFTSIKQLWSLSIPSFFDFVGLLSALARDNA